MTIREMASKGGKASAAKFSPEQRRERARRASLKAVEARRAKAKEQQPTPEQREQRRQQTLPARLKIAEKRRLAKAAKETAA
jgi:hypothetical protein